MTKSEKETTYFIVDPDGKVSVSTFSNMTTVWMLFASPKYSLLKKNSVATPELLDQSTSEKQMVMDALSVNHPSIATPHIENVKLEHSHSLIDYTFEGLPYNAEVALFTNAIKMKPLEYEGLYSAILVNPHLATVQVKVGEEVHEVSVGTSINTLTVDVRGVKDIHYNFVVKYDDQTTENKLTIEDLTSQKWSEEELANAKTTIYRP